MPVQPLKEPRWATDETNNAEPLTGRKDTGIPNGAAVVSAELNFLFFTLYQWQQWVAARAPRDFHMHQTWCAPMLAAWTDGDSGTGVTSVEFSAAATRPGPWLKQLLVANADRATRYSADRPFVGPLSAGTRITMEWLVDATDLAGTPAISWKGGLIHDETTDPSTEDAMVFYKTSASANWKLVSSNDGGTESTDTGVAASGIQRLRLEYYGSDWAGGERLEAWIDDTLVATNDTEFPDGDAMAFGAYSKSTGALNKAIYVSPMTLNADLQAP